MSLPQNIYIQGHQISTLVFFVFLGIIFWFFTLWYESRKDGFDDENFFDLGFLSFLAGGASYYFLNLLLKWLRMYQPYSFVLKPDRLLLSMVTVFVVSLLLVLLYSKGKKWSAFRILDIYAVAFNHFGIFLSLGLTFIYGIYPSLYLALWLALVYFSVLRFRGYKFKSGVVFSLFVLLVCAFGTVFYTKPYYWLFYIFLATISLVNLYFRSKHMPQGHNLPQQFIDRIRGKLQAKEKRLEESEELLKEEDPYMVSGRAVDNAEDIDEAVIEDSQKEISDLSMDLVRKVNLQVRKALARIRIGKYGICEICRKPIDPARLKAFPEATTCLTCSQKLEG